MPEQKWFELNHPDFKPGDEAWSDTYDDVEFRYYGTVLDEVVAKNASVHLECMDTGEWWMNVTTPDGHSFSVNFGVKRKQSAGERRDDEWMQKHLLDWGFHEED